MTSFADDAYAASGKERWPALWQWVWEAHHPGQEAPPVEPLAVLTAWQRTEGWPADAGQDAIDRAITCAEIVDTWARSPDRTAAETAEADRLVAAVLLRMATRDDAEAEALNDAIGDPDSLITGPWARFHFDAAWSLWKLASTINAAGGIVRTPHPLAPIVRAYQTRPLPVEPFRPRPRASLPHLHRMTEDDTRLPDLSTHEHLADSHLPKFPGFEDEILHCPSWLLWMFDRAGGESLKAGRGAPWEMRLFIGALLHLEIVRRDGQWKTLKFPHLRQHEADWPIPDMPSIEAWLHPNGWTNRRRDWHRLPEALHRIHQALSYVPVPGYGSVMMLVPSVIPESPDDPMVEFTIRIPRSAAHGARIDWPRLQQYGTDSAALYRAYLAVTAHLDKSAVRGFPVTREIGAPLLNAKGQPVRRKGGAIVRSTDEAVANPLTRYVPILSDADIARMIGFDGDNRKHRFLARKALERLEADRVIEIVRERRGLRILGPGRNG